MSLISNLQFTGSARTKIPLNNYATTDIMDASAYEAGEIAGWFLITATTSYRFWFSAKFAKNGAGTDYWISPSTMGDAPPAGFAVSITTAGVIQVFIPSVAGFASASVTYALDAPAVGAQYPMSVDGTQVSAASATLQGTVTAAAQTFGGVKTFQDPPVISNASGIVAASDTVPGVVTIAAQTIAGAKTLTSALTVTPTSNQLVLGTTRTVTVTAPTPAAASLTHTIPDVGSNANFVMDQGTQTITGAKTLSSALTVTPTSNQLVLGVTRTVTVTAPTPATASVTHTIPDVGASANFVMSQGAQTIAGAKTLSSALAVTPTTNQLVLGTTNTTTISATAPAASRTYTMPDVGANANFVMDQGTQTVAGAKTLSSALTISPTTNQLVLGVTNTTTISATAPAASRVYTLPDVGASANFVMDQGTQTVAGAKTFSGATVLNNTVNYLYTSISGATTLGAHYFVTGTGSTTYQITLPTAVGITGRVYIVKNRASVALSVATTSSQTIDGSAPATNNLAVNGVLRLISNGANWEAF